MGSKSRALLLSLHEAAELVGYHPRWTSRLLKSADILPVNRRKSHSKTSNQLLFDKAEVEAFVRNRDDEASKDKALNRAVELAYKTGAKTAHIEQRVDLLEYMLGLRSQRLQTDEEELASRYLKAKKLTDWKSPSISLSEVLEWSRYLLALTEEYMFLMEETLGVKEPWKMLMNMCDRMAVAVYGQDAEIPSVAAAQEYLDIGRKNLRSVAYACAARRYGMKSAVEHVPLAREGDVDEEIISIILSREVRMDLRTKRSQKEA